VNRQSRQNLIALAFSVTALLLVWSCLALWLDDRSLPAPWAVATSLGQEFRSGELFFHLGMTLLRVMKQADRLIDPWLILLLNIPALVIIVLAYIWFGLNEVAAVGAVALNKIPNVIVTLREGARSLERQYDEMAAVYRFSQWKRLRHVVLPQLQPFFAAATRSGISLIWKIVLVVELLGRSNGVGFQIHLYFQLFDVASILAYTLSFVAVMLLVEYLLLQPIERRVNRWRAT